MMQIAQHLDRLKHAVIVVAVGLTLFGSLPLLGGLIAWDCWKRQECARDAQAALTRLEKAANEIHCLEQANAERFLAQGSEAITKQQHVIESEKAALADSETALLSVRKAGRTTAVFEKCLPRIELLLKEERTAITNQQRSLAFNELLAEERNVRR